MTLPKDSVEPLMYEKEKEKQRSGQLMQKKKHAAKVTETFLSADQIQNQAELRTTSGPRQRLLREPAVWLWIRRSYVWGLMSLINSGRWCLMLNLGLQLAIIFSTD